MKICRECACKYEEQIHDLGICEFCRWSAFENEQRERHIKRGDCEDRLEDDSETNFPRR